MHITVRKLICHTLFITAFALSLSPIVFAENAGNQTNTKSTDYTFFTPNSIKWTEAPAGIPKGAKLAVLEGDPTKEGPFTMRLKLPANYRINVHTHPGVEHVTVISGEIYLGLGENLDKKKATKLSAGSFAFIEPGIYHFAFTRGPAIIQLHGMGPWKIDFLHSQNQQQTE